MTRKESGSKMDGTEKISQMVDEVEGNEGSVLLDSDTQDATSTEETAAEQKTEQPKGKDPLNLEQKTSEEKKPEASKKLDMAFFKDETEPEQQAASRDRFVPVKEIQKEREKRHAAEQELEQLKQQQNAQTQDTSELYKDLLEDPDDLITGRDALKLADSIANNAVKRYAESIQTQQQSNEVRRRQSELLDQSVNKAREQFSDFDEVTTTAIDNGLFTEAEAREIRTSKNPAAILYAKSKERLSYMGLASKPANIPPSGTERNNNETLETVADRDIGIYEVLNQ